nr:hypothetical protein GCM10020093_021140 [Planobispora longispora]
MVSQWSASKTALDRAQRSIGGGVTSSVRSSVKPHQIYFASGNGPRIVDIEDNSYIDYVLGWGPLLLGHAHPQVGAAVKAQLDRGTLFGGGNLTEIVAAEKFLAALGWAERLLWSNTGTEAVQIALRLARSHTGRDVVIKLGGGYHGWHDTVFASVVVYGGGEAPSRILRGSPRPRWPTCESASTTTSTPVRRSSPPNPAGSPRSWWTRPRPTPEAWFPLRASSRACAACATSTEPY